MNVTVAIELLLQATMAASRLAAVISQARAEGRDDLTDEELHSVIVESDAATAALATEIAKHKAAAAGG